MVRKSDKMWFNKTFLGNFFSLIFTYFIQFLLQNTKQLLSETFLGNLSQTYLKATKMKVLQAVIFNQQIICNCAKTPVLSSCLLFIY